MDSLTGFGISGYRSFAGGEPQLFERLGKVNFVVGQNNAGKSNVLRCVHTALGSRRFEPIDKHDGADIRFWIECTADLLLELLPRTNGADPLALLGSDHFSRTGDASAWIPYVVRDGELQLDPEDLRSALRGLDATRIRRLSSSVASLSGGGPTDDIRRVLDALNLAQHQPRSEFIPAFRQVREGADFTLDGAGIIKRLETLANPTYERLSDRAHFDRIERFVRTVLEDESVALSVTHDGSELHVQRSGHRLPLTSMGTGIEQVVILAAAATMSDATVILLEEPEVYLHPRLQRKLVRFLASDTESQYVIATHSAHMLDFEEASVYHLRLEDNRTNAVLASSPSERFGICDDLGYRASDLLQTNAVIWVEGPSDRIYLRRWLATHSPDLLEHVDYSIMFFGGSLMSHLSGENGEAGNRRLQEFISLRRLNQNMFLVIDSDRTGPEAPLNATKERLIREMGGLTGDVWVTDGYTIENYVPAERLRAAVSAVHPKSAPSWEGEPFLNPLGSTGIQQPNKALIAQHVVATWSDNSDWTADLSEHIRRLSAFIRRANGSSDTQE